MHLNAMRIALKVSYLLTSALVFITAIDLLFHESSPNWLERGQRLLLFVTLIILALASSVSSLKLYGQAASPSCEERCDPNQLTLLRNKALVSFVYSASWLPSLVTLALMQVFVGLGNYHYSPILSFHCRLMRTVPGVCVQGLALSTLVVAWKRLTAAPGESDKRDFSSILARLAVPILVFFRGALYVFLSLTHALPRREVIVNCTTYLTALFCDEDIDNEYLALEHYQSDACALAFIVCLWALCVAQLLPRFARRCLKKQGEKREPSFAVPPSSNHQLIDVVGLLSVFSTLIFYPLLVLHARTSPEGSLKSSFLSTHFHFTLLFSTLVLAIECDPTHEHVLETLEKVPNHTQEEEEDTKPLWVSSKIVEAPVEVEGDVHPVWMSS